MDMDYGSIGGDRGSMDGRIYVRRWQYVSSIPMEHFKLLPWYHPFE